MQGRYHAAAAAGSSSSAPTSPADRGTTGGRQWSTASSTEGEQFACYKLVLWPICMWVSSYMSVDAGTNHGVISTIAAVCAVLYHAMLLSPTTGDIFAAGSSVRRGATSPVPPDGSSTALHQHSPGGLSRLRSAHNLINRKRCSVNKFCYDLAVVTHRYAL
jgi:hypothetical protein